MTEYTKTDLLDIVEGATFLAAGGGGSRASGHSLASHFPDDLKIPVLTVDEAAKSDKLTAVVAYIGAPTAIAGIEKPVAAINALRQLEKVCKLRYGKGIGQIVPVEIGALSSIVACTVAGYEGLPVVDGDGAGRAVPSLTNLTFAALSTDPTAICNVSDESLLITVKAAAATEGLVRPIISASAFDNEAGLALWPMTGEQLRKSVPIRGTLELCREAGKILRITPVDKVKALLQFLAAYGLRPEQLARGTLTKFTDSASGGFDYGTTVIDTGDALLQIYNQNENLILWNDHSSAPPIMVPDPLCYITAAGQPFSNADLTDAMKGTEVILVGMPARPELRQEPLLQSFMTILANTGYAGAYVPFESLLAVNAAAGAKPAARPPAAAPPVREARP